MIGFKFDEVMTGEHIFCGGQNDGLKGFMEFRVRWGGHLSEMLGVLTGSAVLSLHGRMWVDGIANNEKCRGTLELAYREGRITYTIHFYGLVYGHGWQPLTFTGSKTGIRPWNLHRTHTTCHGQIWMRDGTVVSESTTHFRLRTMPAFLASFRLMTKETQ